MRQSARGKAKARISLRVKTFVALVLVGIPAMSLVLLAAYVAGTQIRQQAVGMRYQSLAEWIAEGISSSLSAEVSDAMSIALAPTLLEAINNANNSYGDADQESIVAEIKKIDEDWINATKIDNTIRGYLSNPASKYLQDVLKLRQEKYSEIFVTDEQGAITGATGKTTDFYQADEDWWVKAFNNGNGQNVVQGIEFDESAQVRSVTIAVPVRDPESNTVMGVLKLVVKAEYIFRSVSGLRVEEKGYAGLATQSGEIIVSSSPSAPDQISEDFRRQIVKPGMGWATAIDDREEKNVVGSAAIDMSDIDGEVILNGNKWFVFLQQEMQAAHARIRDMLYKTLLFGLFLVIVISGLGFYATNWIVMPIRILREETQFIARGDLGRKVEIHTNDEIELLAEDINIMSEKLKEIHGNLEQKIEERTVELSEANKKLEAQRSVLLKVNKQLMKASTLKSQFLADICDGLSNPVLNIIRLAEAVLERGTEEFDDAQKNYLNDVLNNAKHLHQLTNEVFSLARATSGKMKLNVSQFSAEDVLRETHDTVKALALEKNIKFVFNIAEDIGPIEADESLFKHIVFNLYTNAIKYNRINGEVTVSASVIGEELEISVADTGIGIRTENQERIFYEFERVEDTETPYYEGAGMGLALAQRFVEMHDGKIRVESDYGKGSSFIFRLPLRRESS